MSPCVLPFWKDSGSSKINMLLCSYHLSTNIWMTLLSWVPLLKSIISFVCYLRDILHMAERSCLMCTVAMTFPARGGTVGRWQCRWFNWDYLSRKKCLSCDPHGGSPLYTNSGSCIRAADQDREEMYSAAGAGMAGDGELQRSLKNN